MIWSFPEIFAGMVPEIMIFEDHHDRRQAWVKAAKQEGVLPTVGTLVFLGAVMLFATLAAKHQWVTGRAGLCFLISLVLAAQPLALWLSLRLSRSRLRRALRQDLLAKGIRVCPDCGYDMRGCPALRCPECGREEGQRH